MRSPTTHEWLRPPADHGVDRPDMHTPQGAQWTGTNRPRTYHPNNQRNTPRHHTRTTPTQGAVRQRASATDSHPLPGSRTPTHPHPHPPTRGRANGAGREVPQSCGCHGGGETPGPIPNPEAKPTSADGTAGETRWESRTPPHNTQVRPPEHLRGTD